MSMATLAQKRRPMRVLLVEDNKGDILLICRALIQSGVPHEITVVRNGQEALAVLHSDDTNSWPDIVFLDLNLPGMSGHEVLQTIKESSAHKHLPVFMLSSSRASEDVVRCYQSHTNCYLVKPHDLSALREIIQRVGRFWFSLAVLPSHTTQWGTV